MNQLHLLISIVSRVHHFPNSVLSSLGARFQRAELRRAMLRWTSRTCASRRREGRLKINVSTHFRLIRSLRYTEDAKSAGSHLQKPGPARAVNQGGRRIAQMRGDQVEFQCRGWTVRRK
eukprot:5574216-Pleurochrysis_carterae.AAC.3